MATGARSTRIRACLTYAGRFPETDLIEDGAIQTVGQIGKEGGKRFNAPQTSKRVEQFMRFRVVAARDWPTAVAMELPAKEVGDTALEIHDLVPGFRQLGVEGAAVEFDAKCGGVRLLRAILIHLVATVRRQLTNGERQESVGIGHGRSTDRSPDGPSLRRAEGYALMTVS